MSNATIFEVAWTLIWLLALVFPLLLIRRTFMERDLMREDKLRDVPKLDPLSHEINERSTQFLLTILVSIMIVPSIFVLVGAVLSFLPPTPGVSMVITPTQAVFLIGAFGAAIGKNVGLFITWQYKVRLSEFVRNYHLQKEKTYGDAAGHDEVRSRPIY